MPLCECGCGLSVPRVGLRFFSKIHSRRYWMRTRPERKRISARKSYLKHKEAILRRNKLWRVKNHDNLMRSKKKYYEENKDRFRAYFRDNGRRYRANFHNFSEEKKRHVRDIKLRHSLRYYWANRETECRKRREYNRRNRQKINAATRKRIRSNLRLQIRQRLTTRLKRACKGAGRKSIQTLIGCTWDHLKNHIENLFVDGMTWENRGLWHIDHIMPCARFDLRDTEQQHRCFHYTNLQPMWALDNIRKGAKILHEPLLEMLQGVAGWKNRVRSSQFRKRNAHRRAV